MSYEKTKEILIRECELIQNAQNAQEKIRQAVINRDWTDFEDHFKVINSIESELEILERERETVMNDYAACGNMAQGGMKDAKGRFYTMVCILPEAERNEITAIYRSLKLETLRLRMANDDFMNYLAGIKTMFTDFFALAFPDRGGKMYTPTGKHFSHDMRSMVLNQRF